MRVTPFHLRDSCPHSCPFELNSPFPVHFSSLISKMSMFTHHLLFDHFQFILIHGPNIPGSYAILLFTALDFTSITSHIHNWALFCFGSVSSFFLELFLHSSPVAYWAPTDPGSSSFTCLIFLPFHTVHGVLKARILKWFAIPISSGPDFVRSLQHDPSVLGGPTWHGS